MLNIGFVLGYTLIFIRLIFVSTQYIYVLGLFCDTGYMSVSLPSDKQFEIQQLAHSLFADSACYSPPDHILFWARPFFLAMDMHTFTDCVVSFKVTC